MIGSRKHDHDLLEQVEQVRRAYPSLQEQLDRYRADRRSYDLARKRPALRQIPAAFERRYGMSSAGFCERHRAEEPLPEIPGFHRRAWAGFYRDLRRLRGDEFVEHAEHVLALSH